jgi:hypothetical protein
MLYIFIQDMIREPQHPPTPEHMVECFAGKRVINGALQGKGNYLYKPRTQLKALLLSHYARCNLDRHNVMTSSCLPACRLQMQLKGESCDKLIRHNSNAAFRRQNVCHSLRYSTSSSMYTWLCSHQAIAIASLKNATYCFTYMHVLCALPCVAENPKPSSLEGWTQAAGEPRPGSRYLQARRH